MIAKAAPQPAKSGLRPRRQQSPAEAARAEKHKAAEAWMRERLNDIYNG